MKLQPYSVAVVVRDRKKAQRWFTQKLGLELLESSEHWVLVGSKRTGVRLHLCQTSEYMPKAPREKGNTGILFMVKGPIESAYRDLQKRGVVFDHPPKKMEWGWYCSFLDPDGNQFWLVPA